MLVIYSVVYLCQSFVIVIRICSYCLFIGIRYYSSVIVCCSIILLHFHLSFVLVVVWKEKEKFWTWPCSGISILQYIKYLLTTTCSTSSSRVNKHHTADSTDFVLVQEAKEPITIIDKRDRRNQYSPYSNLSRGRDKSDVWCLLTCIDDDGGSCTMYSRFLYNGIKIPGIQSRIRIESFLFEQRTMKSKRNEWNINQTKDKRKSQTTIIIILDITGAWALCTT